MNIEIFIKENNIILEESFCTSLKKMAKKYKNEKNMKTLDEVYKLIGTRKEYIYYWENHLSSSQQKKL